MMVLLFWLFTQIRASGVPLHKLNFNTRQLVAMLTWDFYTDIEKQLLWELSQNAKFF